MRGELLPCPVGSPMWLANPLGVFAGKMRPPSCLPRGLGRLAANRPAPPRGKSPGADNDQPTHDQRKTNDRSPPPASSWRHGQENLAPVWKNPEAEPPRSVLRPTLRLACRASAQHRSSIRSPEPAAGNAAADLGTGPAGDGAGAAPRPPSSRWSLAPRSMREATASESSLAAGSSCA